MINSGTWTNHYPGSGKATRSVPRILRRSLTLFFLPCLTHSRYFVRHVSDVLMACDASGMASPPVTAARGAMLHTIAASCCIIRCFQPAGSATMDQLGLVEYTATQKNMVIITEGSVIGQVPRAAAAGVDDHFIYVNNPRNPQPKVRRRFSGLDGKHRRETLIIAFSSTQALVSSHSHHICSTV